MIRQALRPHGKLGESLAVHHRPMKQSWSVEALYALVFAVCVLLALLMLAT
jgi:uncharacterized membrane protein YidH (DUF202 family)